MWTKKDTIAIIPHYGGDGGYRRGSKPDNRLEYLKRTLSSLKGKATRVVFVCNDEDFEVVSKLDCEELQELPTENPKLLIYDACKEAQKSYRAFNFVLYTDADHEFTIKEEAFKNLPKGSYVVPHRLEEVVGGKGADRGLRHDKYVIINHSLRGRVVNMVEAYSGCYLCHKEDFDKVEFTCLDQGSIGEQPAGFNIFNSGLACFKFGIDEFSVVHLSGRDYHESL